jgi:methylated-DNA-protein-cysteine methyltransferase related protein
MRLDPDDYVEAVLSLVETIPVGRVMTYGGIAEWLGQGGPRQVGAVMSHYGGSVPWHRVVNAAGRLVPGHEVEALSRHRAEGTPMRGDRVNLRQAAWFPADVPPGMPDAAATR